MIIIIIIIIYNYGLHKKLISIIIKLIKGYFPEVRIIKLRKGYFPEVEFNNYDINFS